MWNLKLYSYIYIIWCQNLESTRRDGEGERERESEKERLEREEKDSEMMEIDLKKMLAIAIIEEVVWSVSTGKINSWVFYVGLMILSGQIC